MAQCISCGAELHPERAEKYNYCMAPACQEKNVKSLTVVSVGMNKAADELMLLDERTREGLASGRYADQRRGYVGQLDRLVDPSAGTPAAGTEPRAAAKSAPEHAASTATAPRPARRVTEDRPRPATPAPRRKAWSVKQERLAVLYNQQGLRPDEIAQKLGISRYLVTQIILSARNRGKA
ncbi:MAG TPA: hypothetical protein VGM53_17955 [Streptosporangiaceae bacterium]